MVVFIDYFSLTEDMVELDAGSKMLCIEDRLRSLGMLNYLTSDSTLDATMFSGIQLEANMPQKKVCSM